MSRPSARTVLALAVFLFLPAALSAVPPQKPGAARIAGVAFSPDGKTLATANTSGAIQLWDAATGAAAGTLADLQTVVGVAFSPDGKTLASATWDAGVTLWDVPTAQVRAVLKGHTDTIERLRFSPDGKTLVTASWDGTVKLWDVESGRPKQSIQGPGTQRSVAVSPDGKAVAIGTSGNLRVVDLATGKELFTRENTNDVRSLDFSPDGRKLLMAYHGAQESTVRLLDAATGQEAFAVG
jgi:WD40 repeat protein